MPADATLRPQWLDTEPDVFSPNQFWPIRNGWAVSSRRQYTGVWAGGDGLEGGDDTLGRIALYYQNFLRLKVKSELVDVPNVGPLKFTDAPIGQRRGLNRIQKTAILRFKSASGATGELHLSDYSIVLD